MAVIKSKERSLHRNRNIIIRNVLIVYILMGLSVLLDLIKLKEILFLRQTVLLMGIIYIQGKFKEIHILNIGIKGEKKVSKRLSKLSNKYYVYNDITLWDGYKGAQIDHLVISTYGIYNIETKNMKGEIIGEENESLWKQKKIGKRGNIYYSNFKNPIEQCKEHERILNNFFQINNINLENKIKSLLVFNDLKGCSINVNSREIKVLNSGDITNYITKNDKKIKKINLELLDKITKMLDRRIEGRK